MGSLQFLIKTMIFRSSLLDCAEVLIVQKEKRESFHFPEQCQILRETGAVNGMTYYKTHTSHQCGIID